MQQHVPRAAMEKSSRKIRQSLSRISESGFSDQCLSSMAPLDLTSLRAVKDRKRRGGGRSELSRQHPERSSEEEMKRTSSYPAAPCRSLPAFPFQTCQSWAPDPECPARPEGCSFCRLPCLHRDRLVLLRGLLDGDHDCSHWAWRRWERCKVRREDRPRWLLCRRCGPSRSRPCGWRRFWSAVQEKGRISELSLGRY